MNLTLKMVDLNWNFSVPLRAIYIDAAEIVADKMREHAEEAESAIWASPLPPPSLGL